MCVRGLFLGQDLHKMCENFKDNGSVPALRSALPLSKLQCRQLSLLKTGVSYSFTTDALTGQKLFIQVANVYSRFTVFYGNRN